MIIIVDTDGLVGSLITQDQLYEASQRILQKLSKKDAQLIYPATTIAEAVTLLQGRLNQPKLAAQIIDLVNNNQLQIVSIDKEIIQKASLSMDFKRTKHNTLFDAIVAVVAQKHNADAIFSFDKFYKSKGFKLASEL